MLCHKEAHWFQARFHRNARGHLCVITLHEKTFNMANGVRALVLLWQLIAKMQYIGYVETPRTGILWLESSENFLGQHVKSATNLVIPWESKYMVKCSLNECLVHQVFVYATWKRITRKGITREDNSKKHHDSHVPCHILFSNQMPCHASGHFASSRFDIIFNFQNVENKEQGCSLKHEFHA